MLCCAAPGAAAGAGPSSAAGVGGRPDEAGGGGGCGGRSPDEQEERLEFRTTAGCVALCCAGTEALEHEVEVVSSQQDASSEVGGRLLEVRVGSSDSGVWDAALDPWPHGVEAVQLIGPTLPDCFSEHNQSAPKWMRVELGDLIVRANEEATARGMYEEVRSGRALVLTVARPERVQAKLLRSDKPWGLSMTYQVEVSECARIRSIQEGGTFWLHNQSGIGPEVKLEDFVHTVNGTTGRAEALAEAMRSATSLDLTLLRLPKPPGVGG